jgi:hypothetical protein
MNMCSYLCAYFLFMMFPLYSYDIIYEHVQLFVCYYTHIYKYVHFSRQQFANSNITYNNIKIRTLLLCPFSHWL